MPPDLSEKTKLFWCVPCFSKLERVKKMKADLQKLENEIKGNILRVNGTVLLNVPVTVTNITTPTKRGPSSAHDLGQPSPKRRRQYSSPKRQILARTVVTGTPSVSVSNILQLLQIIIFIHIRYMHINFALDTTEAKNKCASVQRKQIAKEA